MVRAAVTGLLAAGLAATASGCRGPAPLPARLDVARPERTDAAPLEVQLLDGRSVAWASLLAPRDATLAVFATTWCEVCRAEAPAVLDWARAHPAVPVLYVLSGDALPAVAAVLAARGLGGGAVTWVVDADGRLADRYAVTSTPTLLVLDREGVARESHHLIAEVWNTEGEGRDRR